MKKISKNVGMYIVLIVLVVSLVNVFLGPDSNQKSSQTNVMPYSAMLNEVNNGNVARVRIDHEQLTGTLKSGGEFKTFILDASTLPSILAAKGVEVEVVPPPKNSWLTALLTSLLPTLLLIGVWIYFIYNMQGGGSKVMGFAKSKAKLFLDNRPKVTFDDVAGCDESKEELEEVVQFLKDPAKFTKLGARVPRGVLLLGAPGTGKTLLSRAVAGEADVPFFSISGSDFVEMFVGVGAARVRDLFEQARKYQPCIIFIDEIDAVGRHRGAGLGGGHDEREQTLNQLLVEMDGFTNNEGVIVMAATNRDDILDNALTRPGRFDRRVYIGLPDIRGREAILRVHARGKPLADDVNLNSIARGTPGFSGADLENLLNEAALMAVTNGRHFITSYEIEEAIRKVEMGPEKKSKVMSERARKLTAYHEGGHAVVSEFLDHTDPVHYITIIPRGPSGGATYFRPKEDLENFHSYSELFEDIVVSLGGRVSERLFLDDISTGASGDIQQATHLARAMVTQYGMSEKLGPISYDSSGHSIFIGRDFGMTKSYSEETAAIIDEEVKRIFDEATAKCEHILTQHADVLKGVAEYLLENESMDGEDFSYFCRHGSLPPKRPEPKMRDASIEPPARKISYTFDAPPAPPEPPAIDAGPEGEKPEENGESK